MKLFEKYGVSKTQGWAILRENLDETDLRTSRNAPGYKETRGRKPLLSSADISKLERWIESNGRTIPWEAIPAAAGLDIQCSGETVRRAMKKTRLRKAHNANCPQAPDLVASPTKRPPKAPNKAVRKQPQIAAQEGFEGGATPH